MTDLNKANRAELEVAVLENDLIETFGGLQELLKMETEILRDKLINWVIEGDETLQWNYKNNQ